MKLSYSEFSTFLKCPRLYDLEERKIEVDYKESEYFSLYGRLIESFFKKYVNDLLPSKKEVTHQLIRDVLKSSWNKILDDSYVDWRDPWVKEDADQIYERTFEDVLKNIEAFDFWGFSKSEITIELTLKKSQDIIVGRLDFLVNYPDGRVAILDGKGTKKMDRVDVDQLYFYALIYYLSHKKLPNQIGFLFYQLQTINYVNIDLETITAFRNKLLIVKHTIQESKEFEAKVKLSKHCRYCIYRFDCDAFNNKKDANREKKLKKISLPDLDGEVTSFGL